MKTNCKLLTIYAKWTMKCGVFYSDKLPPVPQWKSCIMGKNSPLVQHCSYNTVWLLENKWSIHLEQPPFLFTFLFLFKPLLSTLPTIQLSSWVTSLEAIYRITCSFFWSHEKHHTILHTSVRRPLRKPSRLLTSQFIQKPPRCLMNISVRWLKDKLY